MALLDVTLHSLGTSSAQLRLDMEAMDQGLLDRIKQALLKEMRADAWAWFHRNQEVVLFIFEKKILFIPVKFEAKVKHTKVVFKLIFGEDPTHLNTLLKLMDPP